MKILNSLTITADDLNLTLNPLGSANFTNLSTSLLNDYLISSESYQGYIDTVINNDNIWYNGESFPFILTPTSKNSAGLYASSSYVTINTQNPYSSNVSNVNYIISTVAGTGVYNSTGDGGLATLATFKNPNSVAVDSQGNIFIVDYFASRVRKITATSGIISAYAGTGTPGYSGDGGSAASALLNYPTCVTVDKYDNVYIADNVNNRIRKVTATSGIITTIAGNGTNTNTGDGGSATASTISNPTGVVVDNDLNIYINAYSGGGNNTIIRKITATSGIITTYAGGGATILDNVGATLSTIGGTQEISIDSLGNLYINQYGYNLIRKVDVSTQIITTIAGVSGGLTASYILSTNAGLNSPVVSYIDKWFNLYLCDSNNYIVRKISANNNIISTIAGQFGLTSSANTTDGNLATNAKFGGGINGIYGDTYGNIYICDYLNNQIRKLTPINTPFSLNGLTNSTISIDNSGNITFDSTKNFGEFIINDSTAATGDILMNNNGNIYWNNPGFTQTAYWDGYNDIGGLPNLRSFSATFSFTTNAVTNLRYTITWGQTFTSSITSGITSSAGSGVNYVDIYHNLNNTYSVVSFFAFTASQWQYLYPTVGLSGITGTFSYSLTNNRVRLSLTGSLPTNQVQINVIG